MLYCTQYGSTFHKTGLKWCNTIIAMMAQLTLRKTFLQQVITFTMHALITFITTSLVLLKNEVCDRVKDRGALDPLLQYPSDPKKCTVPQRLAIVSHQIALTHLNSIK
jgi:hypothetical protein